MEYHRAIIDGFKRFESTRKRAGLVPLEDQISALRDGRLERVNAFMERFRRSIRSVRKGAIAANAHSEQGNYSGDDEKKALEDLSKERFAGPKRLPNLPEKVALVKKRRDPVTGEIHKVREIITDPERIQELLIKRKQQSRNNNNAVEDNHHDGNLKLNVSLKKIARDRKSSRSDRRQRSTDQSKSSKPNSAPAHRITVKFSGQSVVKEVSSRSLRGAPKRPPRKTPVQRLNDLLLEIEQQMENARGYNESVFDNNPRIRIFLVTDETPEDRKLYSLNLAKPEDPNIG